MSGPYRFWTQRAFRTKRSAVFAVRFPAHEENDRGCHEIQDVHRQTVAAERYLEGQIEDRQECHRSSRRHRPENQFLRHSSIFGLQKFVEMNARIDDVLQYTDAPEPESSLICGIAPAGTVRSNGCWR